VGQKQSQLHVSRSRLIWNFLLNDVDWCTVITFTFLLITLGAFLTGCTITTTVYDTTNVYVQVGAFNIDIGELHGD